MTRILFFGDLAPSGFGTVTMDLGAALLARGEDVRFVSQNEVPRLPEPFASQTIDTTSLLAQAMTTVTPAGAILAPRVDAARFVPDVLAGKAGDHFTVSGVAWGDWHPQACILLGDFAAARLFVRPYLAAFAAVPSYHYVPIEGVDLPPSWADLWRVAHPVAVTEFGADQIERVVGYRPPVVYHGVDTTVFRPVTPREPLAVQPARDVTKPITIASKHAAKAFFAPELVKHRWVLRTDRHMPRKNQNSLLRAMAPVLASHPDTVLVLHCRPWDEGGMLFDSVSKMPAEIRERVILPDLGPLPRDALVALYNAADVYVSTGAEGFGLTIAEAVACGLPAVGIDFSAVPEVIGPAGMVVPVESLMDNVYDHLWARVDEEAFGKAVSWLLDHPHRAQAIGALGPAHVRSKFSWTIAAEQFAALAATTAGGPS